MVSLTRIRHDNFLTVILVLGRATRTLLGLGLTKVRAATTLRAAPHAIAHFKGCNFRANLGHVAHNLMADHNRQLSLAPSPERGVDVGAADTAEGDLDLHVLLTESTGLVRPRDELAVLLFDSVALDERVIVADRGGGLVRKITVVTGHHEEKKKKKERE